MDKIKRYLVIVVTSLLLFTQAWAAERTAPTFPTSATVESGKTYYLYNIGTDKFLTRSTTGTSYPGLGEYRNAIAIDVKEKTDGSYTLQISESKYYIYAQSSSMSTQSSLDRECYYTITGNASSYKIQRAPANTSYYKENEFVGYAADATNDRIVPNLTEGNITWKFIEKDAAEYYIAKRRLYDALQTTDTYFYTVDNFEKVYKDPASTTELLKEAADNIEGGLLLSSEYVSREWSDYPIFFVNDAENKWEVSGTSGSYSDHIYISVYSPGTYSLKAQVANDVDATISYMLYSGNGMAAEVYVDGVKVREIAIGMTDEQCGYRYSRYFDKLSPGKHTIEWRYIRASTASSAFSGKIYDIGIEKTPYFEVNLLEPGSLGTEVLYNVDHIKDVRRIKIKGKMNDDDWTKVTMMTGLYSIDLSEALVTSIPKKQFDNSSGHCKFLHEVVLPDSLEEIGEYAFYDSYVQKMNFPKPLKSIGEYAFYYSMISEALLPDSITSIGSSAFYNCHLLTTVHYPKGMTYVPSSCFYYCNHLNTFELHEGITYIGGSSFNQAYLFNPRFPKSLKFIYSDAFRDCAVDSLFIHEGVKVYERAFYDCDKLVYAEFPTSYYEASFQWSLPIIGHCSNLKTLVLKSPTVVGGDGKSAFLSDCPKDVVIKVPSFLVNSYKLDEYWYNYKIEGFNTGDVKNWTLNNDLVMNTRERFDGKPNLTINRTGSIKLNGDAAQLFDTLYTVSYNYYNGRGDDEYARILVNNDATKIIGQYKHDYYVTGKYWYFVSLPFDFKISEVIPSVEGTKCVFRYYDGATRAANGASGNWKNYAADAVIPAGTGFIVQTSANCWLTFAALDNASKQNVVSNEEFVKALAANPADKAANRGWNLVGNPWQCWYNIHALNFVAPITTYDVYNKKYNAYSIIDDDYAIAPNEAFFVQCPENVNSISFPETGRQLTSEIINQQSAPSVNSNAMNRQLVDVLLSYGEFNDRTRVVFNDAASMEYETLFDASKFFATEGDCPQLYTIGGDGTEYAINERPYSGGNVQLGVVLKHDGKHTFSIKRSDVREVVLFDKATGITHNFADGDYTFTADAGNYTDRFVLGVTMAPATTDVANLEEVGISIVAADGSICVSGAEGTVTIIAADGRTVAEIGGNDTLTVSAGTYIVRTNAGAVKVIVK